MNIGSIEGVLKLRDEFVSVLARANAKLSETAGKSRSAFAAVTDGSSKSIAALQKQVKELSGLSAAYKKGGDAVKQYNIQLKVEAALTEAGAAADSVKGRVLRNLVVQREALIATTMEQAEAEAAAAASSARSGAALDNLMGKYMGVAFAAAGFAMAIKTVVTASMEAEEAEMRLATAVSMRDDLVAGSTDTLLALSSELQAVTRFEDEAIQKAEAVLLRFSNIDSGNIEEITRLTLDFAEATGQDAPSAAAALAKALEAPGENIRALKDAGIVLTDSQKKIIDSMVAVGDTAGAQAILLDLLHSKLDGLAQKMGDTASGSFTQLKNALGDLMEQMGAPIMDDLAAGANRLADALDGLSLKIGTAETSTYGLFDALWELGGPLNILMSVHEKLGGLLEDFTNKQGRAGATAATAGEDVVKAWRPVIDMIPELRKLEESLKMDDALGSTMDEATAAVVRQMEEEKRAAEELKRAAEELKREIESLTQTYSPAVAQQKQWATELTRIIALVKAGELPMTVLAAAVKKINDEMAKLETPEFKLDIPSLSEIDTKLEKSGEAYVKKVEDADKEWKSVSDTIDNMAIDQMEADAAGFMKQTLELEKEWEEFQKMIDENFIRGIQESLSGFFEEFFQSGELNFKKLVDSFKSMLFKMLADYLARWIMTNKAMQASNAISTQGGDTTGITSSTSSMAGMGAMSTAGLYVAAFAALYEIAKSTTAARIAKSYGFGTTYNFDYGSGVGTTVTEGASQASQAISAAMRTLADGFRQATGAWVTAMEGVTIMARNDGKAFAVRMGDVAIGTFRTMGEAVVAAFSAAMSTAEFSSQLDPAIKQMLEFAGSKAGAGTFDSPEALLEAVNLIQKLSSMGQGLTETSIAVQKLYGDFAALESQLKSLGVSSADATRLAGNALIDSLSTMRDSITGRQKTAAEEMALRQQEAVLFNAQIALVHSELELRKYELQQRLAMLQGFGGVVSGGGSARPGSGGGTIEEQHPLPYGEDGATYVDNATRGMGNLLAEAFNAQLQMYGIWAKSTTEITASTLSAQVQMSAAANQNVVNQVNYILAQIAAIDSILLNLPKAIDPKEIRLNRGGRGGGSVGPSRDDRRNTAAEELQNLADQLLPSLVAQSRQLTEHFADLRAEMQALGMSTAELGALEAQHRARLQQQAMAEVAQYTQSPYQLALAEITAWGVEMTAVYTELGIPLEQVAEAERTRVDALIAQAEAALGVEQIDQQWLDMADALAFLQQQLADGAISAEDYALAIERAGQQATIALVDSLLRFVDDEQAKLALEQMRWAMEIANMQLQIEYVRSLGILTAEQIAMVEALLGQVVAAGPPTSAGGGYSGGGGGGGNDLADAANALRDAAEALLDYVKSLKQSETLSPLTLGQRFALAQQEYLAGLALAQQWWLPDEQQAEYINALPDLASQYLELAAQMFGTSSAGYQTIFEAVTSALEALATQVAGGTTGWEHFWGYADVWSSAFESMNAFLMQINEGIEDLEPVVQDPGGGTQESMIYRATTPGLQMMAADMTARAVQEGTKLIAEEVCRTGDETSTELRAIRTVLQRQAVRPSTFERRIESGQITGRRRSVA